MAKKIKVVEKKSKNAKWKVKSSKKTRDGKARKPLTKTQRRVRIGILVLCVVAFAGMLIFAGVKICKWFQDDVETAQQQQEAMEVAEVTEVASDEGELVNPPEATEAAESDYWYYTRMPLYEVSFSELKAKNADTVAFIHINNTNVNYPVVQAADNDYYLTHAYDHSYSDAGWVFMDYRSHTSPLSDNLVIYGHGRYNGTVFGSLQSVLTPAWQQNKDNYVIWLSTPTDNLMYQIFSVYSIEAESYYLKQSFANPEEKTAWINTIKSRNIAPTDVTAVASDNILTLSTCKNDNNERIVLHAKLIKRQAR